MSNWNLLFAMLLVFIGQVLVFLQINGQFLWKWVEKNPLLMSVSLGAPIAYLFILSQQHFYKYFEGQLWPSRFIGFSIGILVFSLCAYFLKGEGMNAKTLVCISLSAAIIGIQILWK